MESNDFFLQVQFDQIIQKLFDQYATIRYCAFYVQGQLVSRQRDQITSSSASESDRYEELLVNPALLTLARQRGNIDCGGFRFIVVGYGNFYQVMKEIKGGHVSLCFSLESDIISLTNQTLDFIDSQLHPEPGKSCKENVSDAVDQNTSFQ